MATANFLTFGLSTERTKFRVNIPSPYLRVDQLDGPVEIFFDPAATEGIDLVEGMEFCNEGGEAPIGDVYLSNASGSGNLVFLHSNRLRVSNPSEPGTSATVIPLIRVYMTQTPGANFASQSGVPGNLSITRDDSGAGNSSTVNNVGGATLTCGGTAGGRARLQQSAGNWTNVVGKWADRGNANQSPARIFAYSFRWTVRARNLTDTVDGQCKAFCGFGNLFALQNGNPTTQISGALVGFLASAGAGATWFVHGATSIGGSPFSIDTGVTADGAFNDLEMRIGWDGSEWYWDFYVNGNRVVRNPAGLDALALVVTNWRNQNHEWQAAVAAAGTTVASGELDVSFASGPQVAYIEGAST